MRDRKSYLLAVLVVAGTALYFWAQHELARREKLGSVTVFSPSASGASIYFELTKDSTRFSRRAVLTEDELKNVGALAILSPTAPVSKREAKWLKEFVERGGKLLLGFHGHPTHSALLPLLTALGLPTVVVDNPLYEAGKPSEVTMKEDDSLFRKGETYAFYSALNLEEAGHYFIHREIEKGEVLLVAGLPLISNALIGLKSNRDFAYRLKEGWRPLVIDEYHHFFTDKTGWDLLRSPTFALPLAGLMLALLLYFLFAHTEFHERTMVRRDPPARSFHDLNEQILLSVFDGAASNASALGLHEKFLRRLFPREREKIDRLTGGRPTSDGRMSRDAMLARATRLLKFHRELLQRRGAG